MKPHIRELRDGRSGVGNASFQWGTAMSMLARGTRQWPARARWTLLGLALALALAPRPPAQAQSGEPAGTWHYTKVPGTDISVAWLHARGTVAVPDFCGALAELRDAPAFRQPPFQAAVERQRLGCMMIHCGPPSPSQPRSYMLDLILWGQARIGDAPQPNDARNITLALRSGGRSIALATEGGYRIEPLVFAESRAEPRHYVKFGFGPLPRGDIERILAGPGLTLGPIRGRYATMAGPAEIEIGAYDFATRGGPEALARLDASCK